MTWNGQERRTRLAISGPWGLRIVVVVGIWAGWVTP